ncbi:hypothetical protein OQA88_13584 [Cercophora sp. LCS_1]
MSFTFPQEYGYVLLAATTPFFVNMYHGQLTMVNRKAANIRYPNAYASHDQAEKDPKAFSFNCAQRAHANFTENVTSFTTALLIAGLRYPTVVAAAGTVWSLCRALYARGYVKKGPEGRVAWSIGAVLIDFGLKLTAVYTAAMFALGK